MTEWGIERYAFNDWHIAYGGFTEEEARLMRDVFSRSLPGHYRVVKREEDRWEVVE